MEDKGNEVGTQTTINVNVIRKIAIPRLMLALVTAMSLHGYWLQNHPHTTTWPISMV